MIIVVRRWPIPRTAGAVVPNKKVLLKQKPAFDRRVFLFVLDQ
jgi:hypothetical protein